MISAVQITGATASTSESTRPRPKSFRLWVPIDLTVSFHPHFHYHSGVANETHHEEPPCGVTSHRNLSTCTLNGALIFSSGVHLAAST